RHFIFDYSRNIAEYRFAIAISIDSAQDRHLPVKIRERLCLGVVFAQPCLQYAHVIIASALEPPFAIRTNRTIGKLCAVHTGRETAGPTSQPSENSRPDRVSRNPQPDRS